jgi:hypothetical protein
MNRKGNVAASALASVIAGVPIERARPAANGRARRNAWKDTPKSERANAGSLPRSKRQRKKRGRK